MTNALAQVSASEIKEKDRAMPITIDKATIKIQPALVVVVVNAISGASLSQL